MPQNQNRPPRDTPAQNMGKPQLDQRDPQGQDKALRAMEMISQDLINPGDDEGPEPGTDLYYQLLERAGVPLEVLQKLTEGNMDMPFRDVIRNYGKPQDDEFYGQDVTPDSIRVMDKTEPWVIPNINRIADRDAEAGIPHRGYDIFEQSPSPSGGTQFDRASRYLSTDSQQDNDSTLRQLLMMVLGRPNAPNP